MQPGTLPEIKEAVEQLGYLSPYTEDTVSLITAVALVLFAVFLYPSIKILRERTKDLKEWVDEEKTRRVEYQQQLQHAHEQIKKIRKKRTVINRPKKNPSHSYNTQLEKISH